MRTLNIPINRYDPAASFRHLLSMATSPDNLLIDVVPDSTMRDLCDLRLSDGLIIDQGLTLPHSGGGYYQIQQAELQSIRQVMALPYNRYSVRSDYAEDILAPEEFTVVGKLLGTIQVREV